MVRETGEGLCVGLQEEVKEWPVSMEHSRETYVVRLLMFNLTTTSAATLSDQRLCAIPGSPLRYQEERKMVARTISLSILFVD